MFKLLKNKRLVKDFMFNIKEHKYTIKEAKEKLGELPIAIVRKIGKEIIYADYDGYNDSSKLCELAYFDNLDRWQKEFFIEQRLYKLYI